jgi:thiol:disulfide interchange protein DsbA
MKHTVLATVPLALLLAVGLGACKPSTPETGSTPAAADATAAAPSQPSAEEAQMAAAAQQEIAQLASDAGPPPVEGTDYETIPNGQPFEAVPGKVEVVEVFNHVCPACASFQPLVSAWKSSLPADVNFVYVPAMFGGPFDTYARVFYASQAMGLEDKTHDALYRAIHIDRTLKGERGQDTPQDIGRFYQAYGADPAQFAEAMGSFAVEGKLAKAKQFAQRSGIQGTPTLVVAGKYRVTAPSRIDQVRVANQLISMERAAMGGAAPAAAPAPVEGAAPAAAPAQAAPADAGAN